MDKQESLQAERDALWWRNQELEHRLAQARALLEETLADYEDRHPRTPADYPAVIHRMAKIRAFLAAHSKEASDEH